MFKKLKLNFSIHKTLIIGFVLAGVVPLIVQLILGFYFTQHDLKMQILNQLESVRNIKAQVIKDHFNNLDRQIDTLAQDLMIIKAMTAFKNAFSSQCSSASTENKTEWKNSISHFFQNTFLPELKNKSTQSSINFEPYIQNSSIQTLCLQNAFIAKNPYPLKQKYRLDHLSGTSSYNLAHKIYHPVFKHFLEKLSFYDIFLVEPSQGYIVYTSFKEIDFATSLKSGPFSHTGIGDVYNKSIHSNKGEIFWADYEPYLPSYNAPASFIGTAIWEGNRKIGVLIFQVSIDAVTAIMSEQSGMGKTGETYLVGPDFNLRSDSYLNKKTFSVINSFRNYFNKDLLKTEATQQALNGQIGWTSVKAYYGDQVLSAYAPIEIHGKRWAILAEINENEIDQKIWKSTLTKSLVIGLISIGVLLGLALLISSHISRSVLSVVQEIKNLYQSILLGKFNSRAEVKNVNVDFHEVISMTNQFIDNFVNQVDEKHRLQQLIEFNQRMDSIGALAAGISHDFNNILTFLNAYVEILDVQIPNDPALKEHVARIQQGLDRASALAGQILNVSRQAKQERAPVKAALIVKEISKLLQSTLPKHIDVKKIIADENLYILIDPTELYQIIMNLATNSYHAMQTTGGTLTLSLLKKETPISNTQQYTCSIVIEDTGCGMTEEIKSHLFEPFFTTKPRGQGTGMGLHLVQSLVKKNNGHILVESEPNKGTKIEITFPNLPQPLSKIPDEKVEVSFNSPHSILFIDDEAEICRSFEQNFKDNNCKLIYFQNSLQALDEFLKNPHHFDCIVTDLNMPSLNGLELIKQIRMKDPIIPIILTTGYLQLLNEEQKASLKVEKIILKPYSKTQLILALKEVLEP